MYADTLEELHKMADKIGLQRAWFQNHKSLQHYDLTPSKRTLAVKAGAIETDDHHMVDFMRRYRGTQKNI